MPIGKLVPRHCSICGKKFWVVQGDALGWNPRCSPVCPQCKWQGLTKFVKGLLK